MKKVTKYFFIVCMTCLLGFTTADLNAQRVSKAGTTAAEFLKIGVGTRATGMGGAFVAVSDDASALYWNPAGIAGLEKNEIITAHSRWIGDLDFNYVGAVLNLDKIGHVGFSLTMLSMPDMLVRTEEFQEGTGETFDAADYSVGISYAGNVGERFSIGGTVKFIQQRIWHTKAQAFAVDIGSKFKTDFFGGMIIGATIYNFGTDMQMHGRDLRTFVDPDPTSEGNNDQIPVNLETDKWNLPLNFQFGVSLKPIDTRMHSLLVAVDALHPSSNYESVNVGGEYGFQNRVFL
ncbi:MAG: PorV/PorQ family protein, partial [Gracilimonas sp.]